MKVLVALVFCVAACWVSIEAKESPSRTKIRQRSILVRYPVAVSNFSVPCISCTYANRASCCYYHRRCCGVIAPTVPQTPAPGFCGSSPSAFTCSQTCLADAECLPGLKCCPPPPSICVIPYQENQCPLSINANWNMRPCDALFGCQAGEFCCPNPYAKGCCVPSVMVNPNAVTG